MIPLYGADGRNKGEFLESQLVKLPFVDIVRNKRGNAQRARVIAELVPTLTAKGKAFLQELPSGNVWALKGVRGSGEN